MRGRPRGRPVEGSAWGGDAVTDAAQAGAETEDQPGGGAGLQHKLSTSGLYRHQIPVMDRRRQDLCLLNVSQQLT